MLHYIMLATAHSTALLGRGSALVLQSTYSNVILLHCTSMIDILKITHKFEISIEITHKIDKMYEINFSADDSLSTIFMTFAI